MWQKLKQLLKRKEKTEQEIEREDYLSGKTKCDVCSTPTPYRVKHQYHHTTAVLCARCHENLHRDRSRTRKFKLFGNPFGKKEKPKPEPFVFR